MKRIFLQLKQLLRNERGEITFFACFFVVGIVMLISFLLLYASIRITCINIRNGAKMELNNLSGTIYADTYRSQRETNFEEYLNTLYSSSDYTDMLEATVAGGLDSKIPLSTEDYKVSDISLEFNVEDGRVEYIFYCDVEFYVRMFGHSYPAIQKFFHLPFPFPVSKDKSSQQNQCPYNQDQYYCGNRIATHQQKYSECSHTNKVRQQKWQPVFPISSAVHIVYPCRCFVLIKSVRPMPASFSRMRLILTLKALSSTYN